MIKKAKSGNSLNKFFKEYFSLLRFWNTFKKPLCKWKLNKVMNFFSEVGNEIVKVDVRSIKSIKKSKALKELLNILIV